MTLSVAGKSVIVTGAAGGIGLAIARHLADREARVMCVDDDEIALERELGDHARSEGDLRWFAGDLRRRLTAQNLVSATVDAYGRVDVLVNAARTFAVSDPLDPDSDLVEDLMQRNVLGGLRLSQLVARRMIRQAEAEDDPPIEAGSIINLSSIATGLGRPELLGWSMAAAGIEQMTRSLALALAGHRVRVNCIAFGSIMSASLQRALKSEPAWREDIRRGTPLGRIAPPAELAETVQFLASEGAAFITGQILRVDGGRSLQDPVAIPAH